MKYTKMVLNEWTELILHIWVDELEKKIEDKILSNIVTVFCATSFHWWKENSTQHIWKNIKLNLKRYLFFYEYKND